MTQRGIDIGVVDDLVSGTQGFRYYHGGAWKTGYYDASAQLFVGTAGDRITTVIQGSRVNQNYINNLRAARP